MAERTAASSPRGALILAGLMISVAAIAQTSGPNAPAPARAVDPNEVICEKQEVLGSRLQMRRVCRTRAEWADLRLQDRQDIEKIQVQRGMKGQ
jgi:predicted secreted protein